MSGSNWLRLNSDRALKRRNPDSDLENLYVKFGFKKYEGSKHTMYIHPEFPELRATVTRHRSLPIGYIQFAIKLIDRIEELREEKNAG